MTSRNLICPPLSWWHAVRHSRGASSSISGQSSSPGIHQVLPTSFILPERNLPRHARLLASLSLSFLIILIQLWWSLILLYRRRGVEFSQFYMSFAMWMDIFACTRQPFSVNHFLPPLQSIISSPLFIHWHMEKGPWRRIMSVYKHLMNMMFLWLCIDWHTNSHAKPTDLARTWRKNYEVQYHWPLASRALLAPVKSSTFTPCAGQYIDIISISW